MLALLLVAVSLGLSNFAAAIALGIAGVDQSLKLRVALAFGVFEAGMPIVGLVIGHEVSRALGSHAHLIGGVLLIATGAYTAAQGLRTKDRARSELDLHGGTLVVLAASLSIDNLIVGFALGAYNVPIVFAIALIAVVSVGLSLIGLELGDRLGARVENNSELLAGVVLICVGAMVAADLF